jgi:DNA-binding IclR family transcriptional regulator
VQRLAFTNDGGTEEEVHAPVSGVSDDARPHGSRRGLSTARAVLQVLAFLEQHPDGVRAEEVADVVGKSASTAYHLLASLVDEGFAVHRGGLYSARHEPAPAPARAAGRHALEDAVDDLFLHTHKRCYLGVVRAGVIEITVVRGRQGIARMPGLGTQITDNAHALAMGKVVLARLRPDALGRYVGSGLARYTPSTITSPAELADELRRVRADGYATEREEFDLDFCCAAAPVLDDHGRLAGVLGLSASTRAFDREHDELTAAVRDIAAAAGPPAMPAMELCA